MKKKSVATRDGRATPPAIFATSEGQRKVMERFLTSMNVRPCSVESYRRRLTAHSLRHTAVTLALKGGESLEAVKEFARHENIATTLIYSHAIERERDTCGVTIEAALSKKKRP